MTATNHALTGAIIGLSLHQPFLAVPAALVSHYVLDAIPHAGGLFAIGSKPFTRYLFIDAGICGVLVLALITTQPAYWPLACICAFVATTPDFMWVSMYLAGRAGKRLPKPKLWYAKLHSKVQWYQKPIGWVVELAWAAIAVALLVVMIKN